MGVLGGGRFLMSEVPLYLVSVKTVKAPGGRGRAQMLCEIPRSYVIIDFRLTPGLRDGQVFLKVSSCGEARIMIVRNHELNQDSVRKT